jgi:hypothetical protein
MAPWLLLDLLNDLFVDLLFDDLQLLFINIELDHTAPSASDRRSGHGFLILLDLLDVVLNHCSGSGGPSGSLGATPPSTRRLFDHRLQPFLGFRQQLHLIVVGSIGSRTSS